MPDYADNSIPPPTDPREAIQEILRAVRRNGVRVGFWAVVCLMIGYGLTLIWPAKFESSTEFTMFERALTSESVADDVKKIPLSKRLKQLENELGSRKRIESVMSELEWVEWLETAGQEARRRDLIQKIKANLGVSLESTPLGGTMITLRFQWTQPKQAVRFVNSLRDHWIELTLNGHRNKIEDQKEVLESIVIEREQAFGDALRALQAHERENEIPSLLSPEVNNELKGNYMQQLTLARADHAGSIARVERLESELLSIAREVEQPVPPASAEEVEVRARHKRAVTAFIEAETHYTSTNPRHARAKQELDAALAALAEHGDIELGLVTAPNPLYIVKVSELEDARATEQAHRALVSNTEAELDKAQERLDRWPDVQAESSRLQEKVELSELLLEQAEIAVTPLREQAKRLRGLTLVAGDDIGSAGRQQPFEILETGVEPDTAVMPIGAMIMALSLVIGLTIGIVGPILAEITRSSFGSVKEVSRTLGVPVLGAVDLILTSRDVRARTVQHALTVLTMLMVITALGTALYIYTNHPDVLPAAIHRYVKEMKLALT